MALKESGEMYLETIYVLNKKSDSVRSIDVCEYMGYSKPSVSRAVGLLKKADLINVSKEGFLTLTKSGEEAAKKLFETYSPKVVVITCGKDGGVYFDGKEICSYPIYPAKVVDYNGAGDVFHGAFAAGLTRGFDPYKCCHFASAVSALKCTGVGARESVPTFECVKKYMEENGYEL